MPPKTTHDPVQRQADALLRLWGVGAADTARRYLAEAEKTRKADRIQYWQQVLEMLSPSPPPREA
ncbi:hypothetical protein [Rhodospirillum centenum]|nr:hypothetical protein [Rhodospirillum centenum]